MEDNSLKNTVLELYRSKKWKDILKLNKNSSDKSALKLLWVWPDETNLIFIKRIINNLGCRGISSIGCGCGLLEWIISESTGISVLGFEVNQEWWQSKYSNPKFIPLNYVDNINEDYLNPEFALFFCYFNNREAFQQYVRNYAGNVVVIIGPGEDNWKHTDPKPFNADFGNNEWTLYCYQEVKNTKDYIAVYVKDV